METKNFDLNQNLSIEELETRQELSVAAATELNVEEMDAAAMSRCKSAEVEAAAE
jgi:hypothetical protein